MANQSLVSTSWLTFLHLDSVYKPHLATLPFHVRSTNQNDIPIDVACHRCTLNIQASSGTKNDSSPNEPSWTTVTVSFNGGLLVVTGTWRCS
ncbi:uncharacterized protein TNCV_4892891 [Trichonephila clavipes]|nr:uncharacterized protein TNCV_4892891 [Trichonephila clavipes]